MFTYQKLAFVVTSVILAAARVDAHGYLKSPRSRNWVAAQDGSGGTDTSYPKETCPHCLNRGGTLGQCGVSGSVSYDANLNVFGQPMPPVLQGSYTQGQEIEVEVVLTAHHLGHFEFAACPISPGGIATAECFKQNPLEFVSDPLYGAPKDASYPNRAYIAPPEIARDDTTYEVPGDYYKFVLKLPANLSGDLVLLQWYYVTANSCKLDGYANYPFPGSWGNMQNDVPICGSIPPDGNGFPEQFWNCAEISITGGQGGGSPVAPPTVPVVPTVPGGLFPPIAPSPVAGWKPPVPAWPTAGASGGTCGGGFFGNGICADPNHCCSVWGYCGEGSEYCG